MTLETVQINFDDPAIILDPRPTFEMIRAIGPVVKNDLLGVWMVVGYEEAMTVFHTPEVFSSRAYGMAAQEGPMAGVKYMIAEDAPEQTRLRNVARDAFMRRSLRKFETSVDQVVTEMLDGPAFQNWAAGTEIEAMDAYARMVPATIIAILLGVPREDISQFVEWSELMVATNDSGQRSTEGWEEVKARGMEAEQSLWDYLGEQVEKHKANKQDDLINDLLEANVNGDLAPDEMLATLVLLLIAGNETTTKLIGFGLKLIGEDPALRQRLLDSPDLIPSAVEEFLRFEGVAAILPRLVTEDTTIGGADLKAGEVVIVLNTAANRDPKGFECPNDFQVDRPQNNHVAFGHGAHFCLGNTLARLEARLAISAFLSRHPDYSVKDFAMSSTFLARGLQTLTLTRG